MVQVLAEKGIDIAGNTYDYVITMCSREVEENCPIFPGNANHVLWAFEYPAAFTKTDEER